MNSPNFIISVLFMPTLINLVMSLRSVIGSLTLYQWLNQIRNGDQNALRTIIVHLQNEDHTAIVQTWKLLRARVIKHTSGPLNAKGTDVAMEELVLSYERLEME